MFIVSQKKKKWEKLLSSQKQEFTREAVDKSDSCSATCWASRNLGANHVMWLEGYYFSNAVGESWYPKYDTSKRNFVLVNGTGQILNTQSLFLILHP